MIMRKESFRKHFETLLAALAGILLFMAFGLPTPPQVILLLMHSLPVPLPLLQISISLPFGSHLTTWLTMQAPLSTRQVYMAN